MPQLHHNQPNPELPRHAGQAAAIGAPISFEKMHGLGNDFVVIDRRQQPGLALDRQIIQQLGNRQRGVGFDQLLVIDAPRQNNSDIDLLIYNPDGSEAGACGNGTRCVAALVMGLVDGKATTTPDLMLRIATKAGLLLAYLADDGQVTVDMGPVHADWAAIPLASAQDCDALQFSHDPRVQQLPPGHARSLGNPHCVFMVPDAEAVDLAAIGPLVECAPQFPERTNVEFIHQIGPDLIRMRVWERAAGITQACGSGACASAVVAVDQKLAQFPVTVRLDGGDLIIDRAANGHILMTGPVRHVFHGTYHP